MSIAGRAPTGRRARGSRSVGSLRLRPSNARVRPWVSIQIPGVLVGGLVFALSLTPSLLPREYLMQGLLSGLAFAVGYGVGALGAWLWKFLELPKPRGRARTMLIAASACSVAIVGGIALWRLAIWQDSVRGLMSMQPVSAYRVRVVLIALVMAVVLLAIAWALRACLLAAHRVVERVVPRRVSYVLSTLIVGTLLVLVARGVISRFFLRAADAAFLRIDEQVDEDEIPRPSGEWASGGPGSLIPWSTIGRRGKEFIVEGPSRAQLSEFWGAPAEQPIRVYVGLRSAETAEERASLALEELKRVGGFERAVLIVATPTGTGWLEPGAVDSVEYLHAGDTAIVSMQYSYLPSWLTILVDSERSIDSARALFDKVYAHWRDLPPDSRPRLYLHGLSLGALGSETCADLFTIFEEPIHGGVWSGPPFPSRKWASFVRDRNEGSPAWLPEFRDGTMLRFTGRENTLDPPDSRWGPMRFAYIQYASDPMTFFSPSLFYRRPDWLVGERGPDVSPYLHWYPMVTFLQVLCDLPMATAVPPGYGHNIAPDNYIDAWLAVTQPEISPEVVERVRAEFTEPEYREPDHQ